MHTYKIGSWFLALGCLLMLFACASADDFFWEDDNDNSNWNDFLNWGDTDFEYPDDNTDSALVSVGLGANPPVLNATNIVIGALTIQSNGDVFTGDGTNNFGLTVQSSNFQDGSTLIEDLGSSLTVWQSPVANDFDTDDLTIDGGLLFLRQGAKAQVDSLLTLYDGHRGHDREYD